LEAAASGVARQVIKRGRIAMHTSPDDLQADILSYKVHSPRDMSTRTDAKGQMLDHAFP
jgi:hypothetical protein